VTSIKVFLGRCLASSNIIRSNPGEFTLGNVEIPTKLNFRRRKESGETNSNNYFKFNNFYNINYYYLPIIIINTLLLALQQYDKSIDFYNFWIV